jgi:hypothetical protein
MSFLPGTTANGSFNSIVKAGDNALIYSAGGNNNVNSAFVIAPWNTSSISGLRMDSRGFVGIGTSTPESTLDVNGVINLEPITSTPANVTNKLYNIGGNLYWGGRLVSVATSHDVIFSSVGTTTWTVPAGVAYIDVEVWGGGGGGGGANDSGGGSCVNGQGGKQGVYIKQTNVVVSGSVAIAVGTGGGGGAHGGNGVRGGDGFKGGQSSVGSVIAAGGNGGGGGDNGAAPQAGESSSIGTGGSGTGDYSGNTWEAHSGNNAKGYASGGAGGISPCSWPGHGGNGSQGKVIIHY